MRLDAGAEDFDARFRALLLAKRETAEDVDAAVRAIIAEVRTNGDAALIAFTKRFDRFDPQAAGLRIPLEAARQAYETISAETRDALNLARDRIRAHHARQRPQDSRYVDPIGVELGAKWTAVDAAGLYVPGGTASYPSSVLMNAVPAKVAGVERLVMTVPTPDGVLNPLVLAAAHLGEVDEIYRVGGAQAIAALAYGTKTIAPVDKIVGPGNAFVATAKRQVFGTVGIDMIAGPSEVLVVADGGNDPDWLAADLLAQAEHDSAAQSILITDSPDLADAVESAVERQLNTLKRAETARASWSDYGAIILVGRLADAVALINRIAPEHLELACDDAETLLQKVRHAGAVFIGRHTPEVIGDYVGGTNHVLPTARSARFSSGLSVLDFMKRMSILKCGPDALALLAPAAIRLAGEEGLDAHARSVAIRVNS